MPRPDSKLGDSNASSSGWNSMPSKERQIARGGRQHWHAAEWGAGSYRGERRDSQWGWKPRDDEEQPIAPTQEASPSLTREAQVKPTVTTVKPKANTISLQDVLSDGRNFRAKNHDPPPNPQVARRPTPDDAEVSFQKKDKTTKCCQDQMQKRYWFFNRRMATRAAPRARQQHQRLNVIYRERRLARIHLDNTAATRTDSRDSSRDRHNGTRSARGDRCKQGNSKRRMTSSTEARRPTGEQGRRGMHGDTTRRQQATNHTARVSDGGAETRRRPESPTQMPEHPGNMLQGSTSRRHWAAYEATRQTTTTVTSGQRPGRRRISRAQVQAKSRGDRRTSGTRSGNERAYAHARTMNVQRTELYQYQNRRRQVVHHLR